MRYPVGTKFMKRYGKVMQEHTVRDYYVTRNLAGEVVRERYVTTHEVMGQLVFDFDISETTIARALWKQSD